jgi:hypothetical protein
MCFSEQLPDRGRVGLELTQKRGKVFAQLVPEAVLVEDIPIGQVLAWEDKNQSVGKK